jgi:hypothetical protein
VNGVADFGRVESALGVKDFVGGELCDKSERERRQERSILEYCSLSLRPHAELE